MRLKYAGRGKEEPPHAVCLAWIRAAFFADRDDSFAVFTKIFGLAALSQYEASLSK